MIADLGQLRQQLTDRLADLNARVKVLETDKHQPHDDDSAEQALEREDDEMVDGIETAALAEINDITIALRRLDLGTYGLCTLCGEAIAAKRLRARPAALECIRCADALSGT